MKSRKDCLGLLGRSHAEMRVARLGQRPGSWLKHERELDVIATDNSVSCVPTIIAYASANKGRKAVSIPSSW